MSNDQNKVFARLLMDIFSQFFLTMCLLISEKVLQYNAIPKFSVGELTSNPLPMYLIQTSIKTMFFEFGHGKLPLC